MNYYSLFLKQNFLRMFFNRNFIKMSFHGEIEPFLVFCKNFDRLIYMFEELKDCPSWHIRIDHSEYLAFSPNEDIERKCQKKTSYLFGNKKSQSSILYWKRNGLPLGLHAGMCWDRIPHTTRQTVKPEIKPP